MARKKAPPPPLPSPLVWQQQILQLPSTASVLLAGGRYSGKSWLLALLILRASAPREQGGHGAAFRGLLLRSDLAGLLKISELMRDLIQAVYGTAAKYKRAERCWELPTGGELRLGHLGDEASAAKTQGLDYSVLALDDAGLIPPELVRRTMTGLRCADPTITPVAYVTANPGNRHSALWARVLSEAPAGLPQVFSCGEMGGRPWIVSRSNIFDNTALTEAQRDDYVELLKARANGNHSVEQAEIYGRWDAISGGFFANLDAARIRVPDGHWAAPSRYAWQGQLREQISAERAWLAMDWGGGASPTWCGLAIQLADAISLDYGLTLDAGSLLLLDEVHTAREGLSGQIDVDRATGSDDTATVTAKVRRMCGAWELRPEAIPLGRRIIDAAAGARTGSRHGSIAAELAAEGLAWTASSKGRRADGWQVLSKLFRQAGRGRPGLFVSERCNYWWSTVPVLPVHRNDLSDLEGPDHAADAVRYLAVEMFGAGAFSATAGARVY